MEGFVSSTDESKLTYGKDFFGIARFTPCPLSSTTIDFFKGEFLQNTFSPPPPPLPHSSDLPPDEEGQQLCSKKGYHLQPDWQPKFCELFCDERTLVFRDSEHDDVSIIVRNLNSRYVCVVLSECCQDRRQRLCSARRVLSG